MFGTCRRLVSPPLLVIFFTVSATAVVGDPPKDSSPPRVSAKTLAADFAKDTTAAAKKYGDRYNLKEVIVTGTVIAFADGKYGKVAKLEGTPKVTVSFILDKHDEQVVKKGDKIVIKGKCRGLLEKLNTVDINGARLVKDK